MVIESLFFLKKNNLPCLYATIYKKNYQKKNYIKKNCNNFSFEVVFILLLDFVFF